MVVDKQGKIILLNDAAEKMFNYEPGELIGRSINNLVPKRYRMEHLSHMKEYGLNPSPRKMGLGRDLWALKKDGSEFPIEISLNNAMINDEEVSIAFAIDISKRKQAEVALKKSEEQLIVYANELESKVRERTEKLNTTVNQLETANEELQKQIIERQKAEEETRVALSKERELNELKSRFVSMASHEFRTPLSAILSSASLISKYEEKGDSEKRLKHINRIKASVGNLTNILDDFLSLGKLEEGRIEVLFDQCNLMGLVEDVNEEMRVLLKMGQEIRVSEEGSSIPVETDSRLLKNVLINLTSNAIKYSPEHKEVVITIAYKPELVEISISDKGIGIPEEDQKHLFTRFFRAANAINLQGTGLGLNIVKKYLELINGSITFKSELNKGTTFTIQLPVKHNEQ